MISKEAAAENLLPRETTPLTFLHYDHDYGKYCHLFRPAVAGENVVCASERGRSG